MCFNQLSPDALHYVPFCEPELSKSNSCALPLGVFYGHVESAVDKTSNEGKRGLYPVELPGSTSQLSRSRQRKFFAPCLVCKVILHAGSVLLAQGETRAKVKTGGEAKY